MDRLNSILWDERDLLEDLLFALEVDRWVRASGRDRFAARAQGRLRETGALLRRTEVVRAAESDAAAVRLGLAPSPSLAQLAERVGDPWRTILLDQRTALRAATREVARAGRATAAPADL